jgi:hypothetical protein
VGLRVIPHPVLVDRVPRASVRRERRADLLHDAHDAQQRRGRRSNWNQRTDREMELLSRRWRENHFEHAGGWHRPSALHHVQVGGEARSCLAIQQERRELKCA